MHLINSQLSVQYSRGNNENANWRTAPKMTLLFSRTVHYLYRGRQTDRKREREKERGGDMKHDVCSGLLLEHCVNSSVASIVKHQ